MQGCFCVRSHWAGSHAPSVIKSISFHDATGHFQRLFVCPKTRVFGCCRILTPGAVVSGLGELLAVFLSSGFSGVGAQVQLAGPKPTAVAKD